MDIEQDYIMKLIQEIIKVVRTILLDRKKPEEVYNPDESTQIDALQNLAIRLADKGQINEAENLLFDKMNSVDNNQFYVLLAFYEHVNGYSDEFLLKHGYSREEIIQGITDVSRTYGVSETILQLLMKTLSI